MERNTIIAIIGIIVIILVILFKTKKTEDFCHKEQFCSQCVEAFTTSPKANHKVVSVKGKGKVTHHIVQTPRVKLVSK